MQRAQTRSAIVLPSLQIDLPAQSKDNVAVPVLARATSQAASPPYEDCSSRASPTPPPPTSPNDSDAQETPCDAHTKPAPWELTREEGEEDAKSGVRKMSWRTEEDARLVELVEMHGASNWSRIAAELPNRVGKQCRERWHNHLSPSVKKESFTEAEVS